MTKILIIVVIVIIILIIALAIYFSSDDKQEKLASYRKRIFNPKITDIRLESPIAEEPHFQRVMDLTKQLPREFNINEFFFVMLYKKYFDRDDVYSMCDEKDIKQTGDLAQKVIGIDGDFMETGCWRGGMGMYLKAILNTYNSKKKLYLMDTFSHFPEPKLGETDKMVHPVTKLLYEKYYPVDKIKKRFQELELLDDNVIFVKGEFENSVPKIEKDIKHIALLRIDSDYYDSVKYILEKFYSKVSKGGVIIIDDYNNTAVNCKQAVDEFRKANQIKSELVNSINGAIYWIK